ncbi:lycopene cyclase domain-containing protein [Halorarius halobius]|uniref:lycopene cyclase domain-containing protein n=1 Tax=Halorarius halobius TaxID=2962671 RepID=UPI0020CF0DE6|nr:lycopene cyclase domain-containing protein [Halorarius halobius]
MTGFTYLQFHVAFLLFALLALVPMVVVSRPRVAGRPVWEGNAYWGGVAVVTVVALAYTIPWDNYLIARGVWSYGEGRVAARVALAPVEEYLFILVQPWLTALWLSHLALPDWDDRPLRVRPRVVAGLLAAGVGVAGVALFLAGGPTLYLGAILAWAAPVLALQWGVGAPQLWAGRRTLAVGVGLPTLYLCVADRIALALGVWTLSPRYTTGIEVAGLPVEEGLFFLVTNLFVVQGLLLFRWVTDRWW